MMLDLALLLQDPVLPRELLPQNLVPGGAERARDVVSAVIEMALLTWVYYVFLRFLHGKAGLSVFKGVLKLILGIALGLVILAKLFGISFPRLEYAGVEMLPIAAVVIVILFQPELRRGLLALNERGSLSAPGLPGHVSDLSNSFRALARRRHGALVVFERQTGIKGLQDTGVPIDAEVSGALLESIFFPKSPMHDGAVLVREGRIVAASCMLPLTESNAVSREFGTRHRAAMGVTEESDAVAVVVSEETGRISLARKGQLQAVVEEMALDELLADLLAGRGAENGR